MSSIAGPGYQPHRFAKGHCRTRRVSETAEWHAMRQRYERFMATELGQLYRAYDHATIAYWRMDANPTVSDQRLKKLDEAARAASNAFVAKLMDIAGV